MSVVSHLIHDLEDSISRGPQDKRVENLRRVTDLFLRDSEALTEEQIDLFDVVIARLAAAIETRARVELADRLADVGNAPRGIIRSLAHDEIAVARPVLARSPRLSDEDLVSVALAKGRDHMLAITERSVLTETVTDVLVKRGDRVVVHAMAGNPGARFSQGSMAALVDRSKIDDALQSLLGQRVDLPEGQLSQLVEIAKETARRRLSETMPSQDRPIIDVAVARSATRVGAVVMPGRRDYSGALGLVSGMVAQKPLTEAELGAFAGAGQFEETVCTIAYMTGLTVPAIERLFKEPEAELLLVVSRAMDWRWATVRALLPLRGPEAAQPHQIKRAHDTFEGLSTATSQRVVQFLKIREATQKKGYENAANRQVRSNVR
jgi:uncharacterized protein (DUF2336 family)